MAKKTKKASRGTARESAQELVRFKRVVKERVDLANTVCRMREAAVQASVELWDDGRRSVASRRVSDESVIAALGRLMQSTVDYGTAVKRAYDHGADLEFIAGVAGLMEDVDIDEIRCVMSFSD
jgi:hypothetical protein